MTAKGTLYLIPSVIAENTIDAALPPVNISIMNSLDHFIVEEERTARRFLKSAGYSKSLNEVHMHILNEHTDANEFSELITPLTNGINMGLLSEAGCPCIADPGSQIAALCHQQKIKVHPLTGPSSILLALIASGFNGQNFAFNGYLPVDKNARRKKIKELEMKVLKENQTQAFMEAPYRNNALMQDIMQNCSSDTSLCVASEIMSEQEFIRTLNISDWKKEIPDLHKKTVIFILGK